MVESHSSGPLTPSTPASETFASIAFEDVDKPSPQTPSHRSVRTFASGRSRSASVASNFESPSFHSPMSNMSNMTNIQDQHFPSLNCHISESHRPTGQPMSPVSIQEGLLPAWDGCYQIPKLNTSLGDDKKDDDMCDDAADAMALQILEAVKKGEHFWSL